MAIAAEKRGLKRVCDGCGARFYDFNKRPITCPICEAEFSGAVKAKGRRGKAAEEKKTPADAANEDVKAKDAVKEEDVVDDDDDDDLLDDDDDVLLDTDDDDVVSLDDMDDDDDVLLDDEENELGEPDLDLDELEVDDVDVEDDADEEDKK